MKKLVVFLFTGILCLCITACGGNETEDTSLPDTTSIIPTHSQHSASESASEAVSDTTYDIEAARVEAAEVWGTFLDSVSIFEADAKYEKLMKFYEDTKVVYGRYFGEVCPEKTADDYLNMTQFERFLWYDTYVAPVYATTAKTYDTYFSSLEKWNSNVAGNAYGLLKNQGAEEQAEAYKTLMEWQYNFFLETGCIYNFITEKTSAEENPNYVIPDPVKLTVEQSAQEQEEIKEFQDELQKENK